MLIFSLESCQGAGCALGGRRGKPWTQQKHIMVLRLTSHDHLSTLPFYLNICDEDRSDTKVHADINQSKVKAPSMFERAKEEVYAVIGALHQRKSSRDQSDQLKFNFVKPEGGKKKSNMIRKAKEEIKSLFIEKEKPITIIIIIIIIIIITKKLMEGVMISMKTHQWMKLKLLMFLRELRKKSEAVIDTIDPNVLRFKRDLFLHGDKAKNLHYDKFG